MLFTSEVFETESETCFKLRGLDDVRKKASLHPGSSRHETWKLGGR